jgi:hypothetical protein
MIFNKIINSILKEDEYPSREDRIKALDNLNPTQPVFIFTYVSWDWKQPEPHKKIQSFSDTGMFPYQYETSLGSDAYFVFFSDIKLTDRECGELSLVSCYEEELEGVVQYNKDEDYYTSLVSLEELLSLIRDRDGS